MATTYGSGSALEVSSFADASGGHGRLFDTESPPSMDSLPQPNPPFEFPSRPSSSAPSSLSRATGRRPASVGNATVHPSTDSGLGGRPALPSFSFNPGGSETQDTASNNIRRPAPLPSFSFNPGATGQAIESSMSSPTLSPPSPRLGPIRHGHRRGGSEFVGGHLRSGESITVMSTSPTKSESGFASPNLMPTEPARRRGHAHRRSGAISQHDLTMILKPNNLGTARGGSAPTSPAGLDIGYSFPAADSNPTRPEPIAETPAAAQSANESSPTPKAAPRTRVGFSDTLEFIPRPLSLVSTDTTSTITVPRPSHSVSSSISSIISMGDSTVADREPPRILESPASAIQGGSRPSTAGAVLERTPSLHMPSEEAPSPRRRNSIPVLTGLPTANEETDPGTYRGSKRWSFFGLDSFSSHSPTKSRPRSSSSSGSASRTTDSTVSEQEIEPSNQDEQQISNVKSRGKKKTQRRVRSWTSSILTRKAKSRSHKSKSVRRRSLTPPPPRVESEDEEDEDDDIDAAVDMASAPMVMVTEPATSPGYFQTPPRPRAPPEEDISSPMIDLDAALGPFNTPSSRDPLWDEAQRANAAPKRLLHSAAGMRNFTGPGMHYHRRAESAPALPPFEGRFGMHRFGSSSTMADVFEEEEEDAEKDTDDTSESQSPGAQSPAEEPENISLGTANHASSDSSSSTPTQERDLCIIGPVDAPHIASSAKRKGSGSSLDMQPPGCRMRTETSTSSLHEEVIVEEGSLSPRHGQIGGSELSGSTAPSPRWMSFHKDTPPFDTQSMSLPPPSLMSASPYAVSQSSSFPSPRSPVSYDTQRISTAPSSLHDANSFHSLLMGEPGPEVVRISVDVPSLTSSNSTMTRESNFAAAVRPRGMPFHDQRPASFTSTAFGRRRSSLASLSRLISSAHGERSKLSMEVSCDDESDKKQKVSKTKRLSRMMQFWKGKEPVGP